MNREHFTTEEAIKYKSDDDRDSRITLGEFVEDTQYNRRGRVTEFGGNR